VEGETASLNVEAPSQLATPASQAQTGSRTGSRQGSRPESPVSILKKTDKSASTDDTTFNLSPGDGGLEEKKVLSRSNSLRSKKAAFGEKKKISFDDDVDPLALPESIATDNVFAAIADTSLKSGLKQRSRDSSRENPSIVLTFDPDNVEPADYYPPEDGDEDELMIVLDDMPHDGPELISLGSNKSRSTSRERPARNKGLTGQDLQARNSSETISLEKAERDLTQRENDSSSSLHKQQLQHLAEQTLPETECETDIGLSLEQDYLEGRRMRTSSQTSRSSLGLRGKKSRSGSGVPELELITPQLGKHLSDVNNIESQFDEDFQFESTRGKPTGAKRSSSRDKKQKSDNDFGFESHAASVNKSSEVGYEMLPSEFTGPTTDVSDNSLAIVGSDVAFESKYPIGGYDTLDSGFGTLKHGTELWDLSKAPAAEVAPTQPESEAIYAKIIPKSQRKMYDEPQESGESSNLTEEGFVINRENELGQIDHSTLDYQNCNYGQEALDDEITEYDIDFITGERIRRSKKVSFAEEDERYEIERQAKVIGLPGMSKLFSFVPQKPMKPLPGKEKKSETKPRDVNLTLSIPTTDETSPSNLTTPKTSTAADATSPRAFMSAMTGGLIKSKSPIPGSEVKDSSVFGLILGKSGSRTGSRTSSLDRSSTIAQTQLGQEHQGPQERGREQLRQTIPNRASSPSGSRASSRGSSTGALGSFFKGSSKSSTDDFDQLNTEKTTLENDIKDLDSELSFAKRIGRKVKRKPPKVQKTDFDQLFARGMAKSAEQESHGNMDLFSSMVPDEAGVQTYDENGTRFTPFEVYSQKADFRKSQEAEGIGYAEKVESYLYDQAHTSNVEPVKSQMSQNERSRDRHKRHTKESGSRTTSTSKRTKSESERRKASVDGQDVRNTQTGQEVLKTLEKYSPSQSQQLLSSGQRMAPSPGKSFLEAKSGTEVFRTSIEETDAMSTNIPAMHNDNDILNLQSNEDTVKTDVTGMPTTLSVAPIPPARSPRRGSPNVNPGLCSPPRANEPGDKGLPTHLKPDTLLANEEFYEKLRSGLKIFGSTQSGLNQETVKAVVGLGNAEFYEKLTSGLKTFSSVASDPHFDQLKDKVAPGMGHQEFYNKLSYGLKSMETKQPDDQPDFSKYSHHLGRAEFGSLRKRDSSTQRIGSTAISRTGSTAASRDPSGDRVKQSRDPSGERLRLSRDPSGDKINIQQVLPRAKKNFSLSRQGSNASAMSAMEHESRMSDYSGALPDLEMDDDLEEELLFVEEEELRAVHKTQSLVESFKEGRNFNNIDSTTDVLQKKQEVLMGMDMHRKEILEKKAWIQNGLMTALGFCVVVYLQSMEMLTQ
jgi:hypothetical protein